MQRRHWLAVAALFLACNPKIPNTPPTAVVTAVFDPSATPPILPTPNDLAINPATGLLAIPTPAGATAADQEFIAYLNTLDGYPSGSTAMAQFDGTLKPDSVTATSVLVYDVTAGLTRVTLAPSYTDLAAGPARAQVSVGPPAAGFIAGHTYAVALIGGTMGLQSTSGAPVVASPAWFFLRSLNSLVTCTDLNSATCAPSTSLIPSSITDDPARRLADQTATALKLEQLRLKYKPAVDQVVKDGFARTNLVLLWEFNIATAPQVAFNPPGTVPQPNNPAIDPATGKVDIPIDPSFSAAYQELIHDYFDTLDGFPTSSVASVGILGGNLDPNTVSLRSVLVESLNGIGFPAPPLPSFDAAAHALEVAPAGGSWGKGNEIAIAVLGGSSGIHAASGGPVIPSPVWVLVRGTAPLVSCTIDCTHPAAPVIPAGCASAVNVVPVTLAQAAGLECLRQLYSPLLFGLEKQGVARTDVDIAWTFRTTTLPEVTFDPQNQIIPFPSDLLRSAGPNPHLMLPTPAGAPALEQQLIAQIDSLDGFSLTAPIISETSPTLGPIDVGQLDPTTLNGGTGFFKIAGAGAGPDMLVCLNCRSSPLPDGTPQTQPQQLQFVPKVPLTELSTYGAFLTNSLKDTSGNEVRASPSFAILRLSNPVCDAVTQKSLLPIVSDAQACAAAGLEQTRLQLKPLIDAIGPTGVPRSHITLAWAFTTQTTVTQLTALHDAVKSDGPSSTPSSVFPVPVAAVAPAGLPVSALDPSVYLGTLTLPFTLTGPGGTMNVPGAWASQKATFELTVPAGPAPAAGWPIVMFGHGLQGSHLQVIAIANTLAATGFATIAIDDVWHGDRSTCTGSAIALQMSIPNATDDAACASPANPLVPDPVAAMCGPSGRCIARTGTGSDCTTGGDALCISTHQGYCVAGTCEGADFARGSNGAPLINAWNFLNLTNLLASRDNFRHFALDLTQLVKVLKDTKATGLSAQLQAVGGPPLDGTKIQYVGMSLGGFNGALFNAVDTTATNVALTVPGSNQTVVLLTSPAFAPQRTAFLGALASAGITQGTPEFDSFITLAQTLFDAGDPQNFGLTAVNPPTLPGRKVFIQWIQDDFVVPNPVTDQLVAASSTGTNKPILERIDPSFATLMPADRHGFLLNFVDPTTTLTAQAHVAQFILAGSPQ